LASLALVSGSVSLRGEGPSAEKKPAVLIVRLPADAELYIAGVKCKQTGERREFDTPPLTPGKKFSYAVRAVWKEDDKQVTRAVSAVVQAGQTTRIDLLDLESVPPPLEPKPIGENAKTAPPAPDKKPEPPPGFFKLDSPLTDLTLKPGENKKFPVRIRRDRFKEPVQLLFTGMPAKVTFAKITIPSDQGRGEVEVSAAPDAAPGMARIQLEAKADGQQQKAEFGLSIRKPDVSLKLAPLSPLRITAGSEATLRMSLEARYAEKPIGIAFTGLPRGVTVKPVSASPPVGGATTSAQTTLKAAPETAAGETVVKVVASSEGTRSETELRLIVVKPASLKVRTPDRIEVEAGTRKTVPIDLTREEFSGPVTLTLDGLPASTAIPKQTVPGGRSETTLELAPPREAPSGVFQVKVLALGAGVKAESSIQVTVKKAPPKGILSLAIPETLTLQPGQAKLLPIKVTRKDFEGPVSLTFQGVPAGVTLKETTVSAGKGKVYVEAVAAGDAPEQEQEVTVIGAGKQVRRECVLKVKIAK
jgi:uncharacterized protein (TIGR03000 family)